jgi:hypothetical protein
MKKILRKLYYQIFERYEILETRYVSYEDADMLMLNYDGKMQHEKWVLDTEKEDKNKNIGMVYLCRKKRITE